MRTRNDVNRDRVGLTVAEIDAFVLDAGRRNVEAVCRAPA
jgi:hypothetical protein